MPMGPDKNLTENNLSTQTVHYTVLCLHSTVYTVNVIVNCHHNIHLFDSYLMDVLNNIVGIHN